MQKFKLNKKNKAMVLSILGILTILIFLGGASYAYFKMQGNTNSQGDVNVITATTDQLHFKISNAINLSVSALDFKKGAGNKSDSTTASAILTASNSVNIESTTERYNIYFVIENNDFAYTTSDAKPELLLKVTDPNGNTVENISGLINTENGFDITTRTGSFLLIPDYDITANRGKTTKQDWKVEVTLVNLDTDQTKNTGKTLSGKLYVTKDKMSSYELAQIKNVTTTSTYNSIETNLNIEKGSSEIDKYYFAKELVTKNRSINDVKFVETDTPNYKFTNLEEDATYKIYSYAMDKNGIKSNVYETEVNTDSYVLPSVTNVTHSVTLNSITLNVSAKKGSNDVVKYYYSKDNGATYEESTSNSYTFNNLTDTTEYKIKVKVQDSDGRYSTEYYEAISTETYILPTVASVNATTKYNQISLTATGTKGTNEVAKYYYSINNGTYVEGINTYTFTGLNEKTTYIIKVKVADTQGRISNVYETSVTTDEYVLPSITNVTSSVTFKSVTLNVTSNNGTGNVVKYYYSKDDGSNYVESNSSSYTFDDLTDETTFYLKVKVKDNNGRESSVYSIGAKTEVMTKYWEFINDGTFVVPVTGQYKIEMHGGGGGGSGNISSRLYSSGSPSSYATASGTGGGGSGEIYNTTLNVNDSFEINIGTGGKGGIGKTQNDQEDKNEYGYPGSDGGVTKFGTLFSVAGGAGGGAPYTQINRKGNYYGVTGVPGKGSGSLGSSGGSGYDTYNKVGGYGGSGGATKGSYGSGGRGGSSSGTGYSLEANDGNNGEPGAVFITFIGR